MTLKYDVPEHLESYLEFIPPDMISEFLTKAIEKAIEDRSTEETVKAAEKQQVDYSDLLSKITEMFTTAKISDSVLKPQKDTTFEPPTYSFEVVSSQEENVSDEDKELIDDFLMDICK